MSHNYAITALILGIVSLCLGWFPIFGQLLCLGAIIYGIVAITQTTGDEKVLAITGTVFSVIALLVVIVALFTFVGITNPNQTSSFTMALPSFTLPSFNFSKMTLPSNANTEKSNALETSKSDSTAATTKSTTSGKTSGFTISECNQACAEYPTQSQVTSCQSGCQVIGKEGALLDQMVNSTKIATALITQTTQAVIPTKFVGFTLNDCYQACNEYQLANQKESCKLGCEVIGKPGDLLDQMVLTTRNATALLNE